MLDIDKLDTMLANINMKRLTSCRVVSDKIYVESKYGIHRVIVFDILKGVKPRIQSAIDKRKYFELQSREIHGDRYSYDNVEFQTGHKKVNITCKKHGDFEQTPDKHLMGRGCPECAKLSRSSISIDKSKIKYFTECSIKHNNKYDYSKSVYEGSKHNITVICPTHGEFSIIAGNHLKGCGCIKCSNKGRGWKKTDWINFTKDRECTLYVIKCFNETEEFVKIGITSLSIQKRFGRNQLNSYLYKVVKELKGTGEEMFSLEEYLHKRFKFFHYSPLVEFKGSKKECFTTDILELI
jgi:hypothetical protein